MPTQAMPGRRDRELDRVDGVLDLLGGVEEATGAFAFPEAAIIEGQDVVSMLCQPPGQARWRTLLHAAESVTEDDAGTKVGGGIGNVETRRQPQAWAREEGQIIVLHNTPPAGSHLRTRVTRGEGPFS